MFAAGTGSTPLAGLMQEGEVIDGKRLGVVFCGENIDLALFWDWIVC
ncbi:MAG: hypothetical protein ING24_18875 [Roseomonas sp.]|jgi:threonine dehydratase|nr:hypothetical protein [Roseomonas sp.]MCA3344487.1 hypothetical protein [Roseomonas sp.]